MSNFTSIEDQLAFAEERLMLSDSIVDRCYWGYQCDQLEAYLEDLKSDAQS